MLRAICIAASMLLGGCGPSHIVMSDEKCTWPSIGDTVEGIATLHSYAGTGCIECGSYLTQPKCSGKLGFRNATDEARRAYKLITQRKAGENILGEIERRVFVSGTVIPDGADGKPLLNATHVALVR